MNILFVSDVYFPRINGVSTSIRTLRRELVRLGHKVHLIAPDYQMPSDEDGWITRIPSRHLFLDPEDRMMKISRARRLLDQFRSGKFDIVHIHTPFVAHYLGKWLAKQMGVPCVETYHTFFEGYLHYYVPFLPRWLSVPIVRKISQRQCHQVDGIVLPSQHILDVLRQYGVQSHSAVIPTGIEAERFVAGDGSGFRKRYGISAQRPMMLYVGRVAHEKNIGFLLQVKARVKREIPDTLLVIAGEGPALEQLRRDSERLGLRDNVLFVGYLDCVSELNDCYRAADLFVFASRTETQGLVLLEAMAQGLAVVSTAELGTRSVLINGTGAAVVQEDVNAFSAKTVALLRNQAVRQDLGTSGHLYARQWSVESMAQKMLDFYREAIVKTT
ncbi:MAG TPA: glycosyltransferase [Sulfuricella sp.]|nr:glycosyltransferase [Sulfuricella sp.]